MNEDVKTKWVAALRDPKHPQTQKRLAALDEEGNITGECCLGVLCRIAREEGVELNVGSEHFDNSSFGSNLGDVVTYDHEFALLPPRVCDWAELRSTHPYSLAGKVYLADANDKGMSFAEIADLIESGDLT